jgi:hypothetical protein
VLVLALALTRRRFDALLAEERERRAQIELAALRGGVNARLGAAGVLARVDAAKAAVKTGEFDAAFMSALTAAGDSPKNEDDVRAALLAVLEAPPFSVDTRDVLVKVFVDQETRKLEVRVYPGNEAIQGAIAAIRAEQAEAAANLSAAPAAAA